MSDAELMAAKREIDRAGIGCEPASAVTLAGVRKLQSRGIIEKKDRVVCVLTGNLLKDPDAILKNLPADQMVEIDADLASVERVLG